MRTTTRPQQQGLSPHREGTLRLAQNTTLRIPPCTSAPRFTASPSFGSEPWVRLNTIQGTASLIRSRSRNPHALFGTQPRSDPPHMLISYQPSGGISSCSGVQYPSFSFPRMKLSPPIRKLICKRNFFSGGCILAVRADRILPHARSRCEPSMAELRVKLS